MEKNDLEFVRRVLRELPLGSEMEKALALAQMYGKTPEMETALKQWKAAS